MSPRTPTQPANDRTMWRRLVARTHPDAGGDDELFIWTMATRDAVCGGELGSEIPRRRHSSEDGETWPRRGPTNGSAGDRLNFSAAFVKAAGFGDLTQQAVALADEVGEPYSHLLGLLRDCHEVGEVDSVLYRQQHQGATYKQLAAIAYRVGMSKEQRVAWYRIAEGVPLSQRHAGHVFGRLQKEAA